LFRVAAAHQCEFAARGDPVTGWRYFMFHSNARNHRPGCGVHPHEPVA
jgi:hypothetical protein